MASEAEAIAMPAPSGVSLPPEIWMMVFGTMSQPELLDVSTVSKGFNAVALDPLLWTSLKLTLHPDKSRKATLLKLLSRCTLLSNLELTPGGWPVTDIQEVLFAELIRALPDFCPKLRFLKTEEFPILAVDDVAKIKSSTESAIGGCEIKQKFGKFGTNQGMNTHINPNGDIWGPFVIMSLTLAVDVKLYLKFRSGGFLASVYCHVIVNNNEASRQMLTVTHLDEVMEGEFQDQGDNVRK
jgi:hypothetical protein